LGFGGEIWEKSFYDRQVRAADDYFAYRHYIRQNPVKAGLVTVAEDYLYSSARPGIALDGLPQRLKPMILGA